MFLLGEVDVNYEVDVCIYPQMYRTLHIIGLYIGTNSTLILYCSNILKVSAI